MRVGSGAREELQPSVAAAQAQPRQSPARVRLPARSGAGPTGGAGPTVETAEPWPLLGCQALGRDTSLCAAARPEEPGLGALCRRGVCAAALTRKPPRAPRST